MLLTRKWNIETRPNRKKNEKSLLSQIKTLEEFDFSFQNSISQQSIYDLATLQFIEAKENIIFLGPPGVGKSHLAIALGVKAVLKGYQVRFYTLTDLIAELYAALADNSLDRKINNILKMTLSFWTNWAMCPWMKPHQTIFSSWSPKLTKTVL